MTLRLPPLKRKLLNRGYRLIDLDLLIYRLILSFFRYPEYPAGITEMKRTSIDPQIKSTLNGYRAITIGIVGIQQHKCAQLWGDNYLLIIY